MKEKGFLSLEALAKANPGDIEGAIKECGLQKISSKYLIDVAKEVLLRPDKCFPRAYSELTQLSGLGPKATNVLMNEVFKFATGVPTDRHVDAGAVALLLHVSPPWLKTKNVEHTEISLRTWLCITQCKHINPIMGCITQLFCTRHRTVKESDNNDLCRLMLALQDHIHKRCHMEMVWHAIVRFRQHHLVENKPRPNKTDQDTEAMPETEAAAAAEDEEEEAEAVSADEKAQADNADEAEEEEDAEVETETDQDKTNETETDQDEADANQNEADTRSPTKATKRPAPVTPSPEPRKRRSTEPQEH